MDLSNFKKVRDQTEWVTATGDAILVKRMETSHVQNTIILLDKKVRSCNELGLGALVIKGFKGEEWIELLKTELKYRQDPKSIVPTPTIVPIPARVEEERIAEIEEEEEELVML